MTSEKDQLEEVLSLGRQLEELRNMVPTEHAVHHAKPLSTDLSATELLAEIVALTRALTGLTCGGSEFFVRKGDRYVADIKACTDYVGKVREGQHAVIRGLIAAKQAVEAREKTLRHAALLAADRLRMLLPADLPESDHPGATGYVLDLLEAALTAPPSKIEGEEGA